MVAETTKAPTADERSARPSKKVKGPEHPRAERLAQHLSEVAKGERTMASIAKALVATGLECGGIHTDGLVIYAACERISLLPDDELEDLAKAARRELARRDKRELRGDGGTP